MSAERAPRRTPQQVRSHETRDRVLRAADVEIGERGLLGASTTRIAQRAGLSVGALYRFFADRDAIADALAERYLAAVTPTYADVLVDVASLADVPTVLGELLARAAALQEQHPGYYRLTEDVDPDRVDSPAHAVREQLVDLFAGALRAAGVVTPEEDLRRAVALCIETVRHTLARHPAGAPDRAAAMREVERMLGAYLCDRLASG